MLPHFLRLKGQLSRLTGNRRVVRSSGRDATPFDLMGSPQAHASRVATGYDAVSCPLYVEGVERAGSLPAQWTLAAQGALFP